MIISKDIETFGLSKRSIDTLKAIFQKHTDVKTVYLFGSRAKGNYHEGSDIDLAIMNNGLLPKTIRSLLAECEESSLPVAVDIIAFESLSNDELKEHIQRVGVLFYIAPE
jgi:predicted nucleotidyltransferase